MRVRDKYMNIDILFIFFLKERNPDLTEHFMKIKPHCVAIAHCLFSDFQMSFKGIAHPKLTFHPFANNYPVNGSSDDIFQSMSLFWSFTVGKTFTQWTPIVAVKNTMTWNFWKNIHCSLLDRSHIHGSAQDQQPSEHSSSTLKHFFLNFWCTVVPKVTWHKLCFSLGGSRYTAMSGTMETQTAVSRSRWFCVRDMHVGLHSYCRRLLGGLFSVCKTPEQLHRLENVTRGAAEKGWIANGWKFYYNPWMH